MPGMDMSMSRAKNTIREDIWKLILNPRMEMTYPLIMEPTMLPRNSTPWKKPMELPLRSAPERLMADVMDTRKKKGGRCRIGCGLG